MRTPRTALLAVLVAFAALAVAGCGGGEVSADEVPGAAPALTVPSDSDIGSADSASADDSATRRLQHGRLDGRQLGHRDLRHRHDRHRHHGHRHDRRDDHAVDERHHRRHGHRDRTTTPSTGDGGTTDTPPAAGSAPEQFESFCEQNAGAC